jgi:hypothetical protein
MDFMIKYLDRPENAMKIALMIGDKEIMNVQYLDHCYVIENMIDERHAKFMTLSYNNGRCYKRGWSIGRNLHGPVIDYNYSDITVYNNGHSNCTINYATYGSIWKEMLADYNLMRRELPALLMGAL